MASSYLTRTVTGSSTTKATYSAWVKRSGLGEKNLTAIKAGSDQCRITFTSSDELQVFMHDGSYQYRKVTDRLFRDTSGYYNIVIAFDSTEGAAGDRIKIYVNGVQETEFNNVTDPGASDDCFWFQSATGYLGIEENGSSNGFDGLMTHINMIQGTAYPASTFGQFDSTSGIWTIKTGPSVTYGSQGFFLKMETTSGSGMGTDSSGNGNNYAENGSPTQTVDNPSSVMATLNPLQVYGSPFTFSNGNTKITRSGSWRGVMGTLGITKGKWYYEMKKGTGNMALGMAKFGSAVDDSVYLSTSTAWLGDKAGAWIFYNNHSGAVKYGDGSGGSSYGSAPSDGDILMCAFDADNGTIWIGNGGTWFGSATQGEIEAGTITNAMYSGITMDDPFSPICSSENGNLEFNFGNGYFATTQVASAGTSTSGDDSIWEFDCPDGYYGLNTKNINTYG